MPATAAVLEEVREFEQRLGIEDLADEACRDVRFITALDGKIVD
jgi:hypothetical protein